MLKKIHARAHEYQPRSKDTSLKVWHLIRRRIGGGLIVADGNANEKNENKSNR